MTRVTALSHPLLLGFEEIERLIGRAAKGGGDGYPPYNIERIPRDGDASELLRITLAVAGFTRDQLDITLEDKQLTVRGKQQDDKERDYLYRGIASRQFSRTFVLADGIEVKSADLTKQEKEFRRMEGMICAMTFQERRTPQILNARRRQRIAKGSGVTVAELNTLLNRFSQMQQMMKKMGKFQKMMMKMGGAPRMLPR